MTKEKITFEQFIANALVKFDKLDSTDISLLIGLLKRKKSIDVEILELDHLRNYIKTDNGIITLENSVFEDKKTSELLSELENDSVKDFFDSLDLDELVLRKVEKFGVFDHNQKYNLFNSLELDTFDKLLSQGYLVLYWNDDIPHDDFREVRLSHKGEEKLFIIDNYSEIRAFANTLKDIGYNNRLIYDFLARQDLSLPSMQILTIETFENFCNIYDRSPLDEGVSSLYYRKLKNNKEPFIDKKGKELIKNMLMVLDSDHCIHICHPNHLFAGKGPITRENREIRRINWDNIDVEQMRRINGFKTFISEQPAFNYVHDRLGHQIMKKIVQGKKENAVSYLVAVEEYPFEGEDNYLVRGIIRGDAEGYSLAFNPEYEKTIPTEILDMYERSNGNTIPGAYLVKRRK